MRLEHWLIPTREHASFQPTDGQLAAILDALATSGWLDPGWEAVAAKKGPSDTWRLYELPGVAGRSYEIDVASAPELHTVPKDAHEVRDFTVACSGCGWECLVPDEEQGALDDADQWFEGADSYRLPLQCGRCGTSVPLVEFGDLGLFRFGIRISVNSEGEYAQDGDPALVQNVSKAAGVPFDVMPVYR